MEMQRQAIPLKEKNEEWGERNIDYYISISCFNGVTLTYPSNEIQRAYDAYNDRLRMSDYQYVLKPYGEKTPTNLGNPSKLRNFNILRPTIDLLLGEYAKKPKNYNVIAKNADVETYRLQKMKEELMQNCIAEYTNQLNQQGIDTGEPQQQTSPVEEILKKYDRSTWRDERALAGQLALDFIVQHNEVHDKFKKGFLDFLIAGVVYSLKEPNSNEVSYDVLDPRDVDHDRNPNNDFVEDSEWATLRYLYTVSQIVDVFANDLTPAQLILLEDAVRHGTNDVGINNIVTNPVIGPNNQSDNFWRVNANEIQVYRTFWKSRKKIGVLTYIDETGKEQKQDVDETYKADKNANESIDWFWVNEVWEGTKIGRDIYVRIRPILVQRTSIDNPSLCKLPVNGRNYYSRNHRPISLVMLGLPYQVTYNIYKTRLEEAISKMKGVIGSLDINSKPKDWPLEEWLHYAEKLGFLIVDYKDYKGNPTQQTVLNLTFSEYVRSHLELLNAIKDEWDSLAGITRQRKGQTAASETATGTQSAITQSYLSTEIYNQLYEAYERREYIGLLDTSKFCWLEGKQATFYLPEFGMQFLNIDGIQHSETNYGIFVTNSTAEQSKLQHLQQLGESMIQNGVSAYDVANIIVSESTTKVKQLLAEAEDKKNALDQAKQKQGEDSNERIAKTNQQTEMAKQDREDARNKDNNKTKIYVAEIGNYFKAAGEDDNANGVPDPIEIGKLALEGQKLEFEKKAHQDEMKVHESTLNHEKEMANKEHSIEKAKAQTDIKATENKIALEKEKFKTAQLKAKQSQNSKK